MSFSRRTNRCPHSQCEDARPSKGRERKAGVTCPRQEKRGVEEPGAQGGSIALDPANGPERASSDTEPIPRGAGRCRATGQGF